MILYYIVCKMLPLGETGYKKKEKKKEIMAQYEVGATLEETRLQGFVI